MRQGAFNVFNLKMLSPNRAQTAVRRLECDMFSQNAPQMNVYNLPNFQIAERRVSHTVTPLRRGIQNIWLLAGFRPDAPLDGIQDTPYSP